MIAHETPQRPTAATTPKPSRDSALRDERKTRVTIKDVAKAAGVHFTTVSLALRGHASIPQSTRDYIRATADRLGYAPNPVFQALTHFHLNGRVRADPPRIAYVINHSLESGAVKYRHQGAFLEGAQQQARVLGYELQLVSVGEGLHTSETLAKYLEEHHITGVVLASFEPQHPTVSLDWSRYAVVKINSLHMDPKAPVVANDQRQDLRLAYQRMLALGYRRIGMAVGRADEDGTEYRYTAGYLTAQAMVPPADRVPSLLFPYNATLEEVSALMGQWVRQHAIDAVLCNWSVGDELLSRAGLRVPQDVGFACLCLLDSDDRVAGVCPNLEMVGTKAVSILTTVLKSGEQGLPEYASRTYVRSHWKDGKTAPPKA